MAPRMDVFLDAFCRQRASRRVAPEAQGMAAVVRYEGGMARSSSAAGGTEQQPTVRCMFCLFCTEKGRWARGVRVCSTSFLLFSCAGNRHQVSINTAWTEHGHAQRKHNNPCNPHPHRHPNRWMQLGRELVDSLYYDKTMLLAFWSVESTHGETALGTGEIILSQGRVAILSQILARSCPT